MTDYKKLENELEVQELESPGGVASPQVYGQLLAIYLVHNDLNNAKFLWKRIPQPVKNSTPELSMIWEIGQKLWQSDYSGSYQSMEKEWSEPVKPIITHLQDTVRNRAFNLIAQAYSSINAEEFSQIVGMSVTQAVEAAVAKGWTADAQSRLITPKVPARQSDSVIQNEKHLSSLTSYVSFLEN